MFSYYRVSVFLGVALIVVPPSTPSVGGGGIAQTRYGLVNSETALPNPIAEVNPANPENVAFILGGSGNPIPNQHYVDAMYSLYAQPNFPGYTPESFFVPDGNYIAAPPFVKELGDNTSVTEDVTIMDTAALKQIAEGHHVLFVGFSQTSQASTYLMSDLAQQGVPSSDVSFVLVGDPANRDGGVFQDMAGLTAPAIAHTLRGATPDDLYPTVIYSNEYDIWADAPRYPIDLLSDLNTEVLTDQRHGVYPALTEAQVESAIQLPTTSQDTMTTYYEIPLNNLPLLEPLRSIPVVGQPLADLLQPILTPLVNLGYGDPDFGWAQTPANVPAEFGLSPAPDMIVKALQEAVAGIPKGIQAATSALEGLGSANLSPADLTSTLTPRELNSNFLLPLPEPPETLPDTTDVVSSLTNAFSTAYSLLLPYADIATTEASSIPMYLFSLFARGLEEGNIVQAIGQPIVQDIYLQSLMGFILQADTTGITEMVEGDLKQAASSLTSVNSELSSLAADLSSPGGDLSNLF